VNTNLRPAEQNWWLIITTSLTEAKKLVADKDCQLLYYSVVTSSRPSAIQSLKI